MVFIFSALLFSSSWASLLDAFNLDLSIIDSDELTRSDCRQFTVVNAYAECRELEKILRKFKKGRATPLQLDQARALLWQQLHYLEQQGWEQPDGCVECSPSSPWDGIRKLHDELYCSADSSLSHDKKVYCQCVERRAKKLSPPVVPSQQDREDFEKTWASDLGRRLEGGISATLYQIGYAVAENRILGQEFDGASLPHCDVTQIRSFLTKVRAEGCSNGTNSNAVVKRLELLFPSGVDQLIDSFESLASQVVGSGLPPQEDPEGECFLPRQMQMQYSSLMSLGINEEIYHSLKVLMEVVPEDIAVGIFQTESARPFDKLVQFALEKVEAGELPLPEGINELVWSQAVKARLAQVLQTGQGFKISNTVQSWRGLKDFMNGMSQLSLNAPSWESGRNTFENYNPDAFELLNQSQIQDSFYGELDKNCQNVFGNSLESAVCEPLGTPKDIFAYSNFDNQRFLHLDALYCEEPTNEIYLGMSSFYFSDCEQSVEQDLNNFFDLGVGVSYREFNQLCPLLKSCEDGVCFFNKASSIGEEQLAMLPDLQRELVEKLVQAEKIHEGMQEKSERTRSRSADDMFNEFTGVKDAEAPTAKEEGEAKTVLTVWEYDQQEAKKAVEVNSKIESERNSIEISKYDSGFVNQLLQGPPLTVFPVQLQERLSNFSNKDQIKNKREPRTLEKQESPDKEKIERIMSELKKTYHSIEEQEERAKGLYQQVNSRDRSDIERIERARELDQQRALKSENNQLREIVELRRQNNQLMRERSAYNSQLEHLNRGIEQTQSMIRRQGSQSQKRLQALEQELKREHQDSLEKQKQLDGLQQAKENQPAVVTPMSSPSTHKKRSQQKSKAVSVPAKKTQSAIAGGAVEMAEPQESMVITVASSLPSVNSRDYLSLERSQKLSERGIDSNSPSFSLVTENLAGDELRIPMKAKFNERGEMVGLVPDLSPEHYALISNIGNRLIREDLMAAIRGEQTVPLIEAQDFLAKSESEMIEALGSAEQFNLHLTSKEGEDLLLPFKVLRRGESSENVLLNLVASNYNWVRSSLEQVEDKRVLEKIYQQMAKEDQPSSGK